MTASLTSHRRRGHRFTVHTYTVPVVRELPSQPPEATNYPTW